jgi:hypothetical protein
MSHVDEGTLHAYLDGELPPVERERVDTHLKGCPACQARLAEERALIERASRLLGMATPPERTMPPLEQLRQPRLTWRLRRPLAWAATVILAVGLGWYVRGSFATRATSTATAEQDTRRAEPVAAPTTPAATPPAALSDAAAPLARDEHKVKDSMRRDRAADRELAAGRAAVAANNALATRQTPPAMQKQDSAKLDAVAALPRNAPAVAIRGGRPPAPAAEAPQVTSGVVPVGEAASGVIVVDGAMARRRAPAILSTEWPLIARQPARDVLGMEPVIIPGFAVRAYRRNPAAREIVVEQVTDAGTAISLIERRVDSVDFRADSAAARQYAAAKSVNERLARFVGLLRIEIDGPLTPDSLSSLLELAR